MFFKNELKKCIKNEKGLTLIELLAVVVILAIIAAIAIPAIGNIINNSRAKAVVADAQNAMSAANIYFTDNPGETTFELDATDSKGVADYLEKGTLQTFVITKPTTGANHIKFTAKTANNKTYTIPAATATTGVTLDNLNKATVSKGKIKVDGTEYSPS